MSNIAISGWETKKGNIKERIFFKVPSEEGTYEVEHGLFFCVAKDGDTLRVTHIATDGDVPTAEDFRRECGRVGDWEVAQFVEKHWRGCQFEADW